MPQISFSSDNLRKLLRLNFYCFSEEYYMVFGIRGAVPVGGHIHTFKYSHTLEEANVDYKKANCCIGIWNPVINQIALFPGSTVPSLKYIKKHKEGSARANCMMTGYYSYYEKGFHYPSENNAHPALRLATNIALRRTINDLRYTNEDPIECGNPNDNIHASYCNDINGEYCSAGCQVIVGQPKCKGRGNDSTNTAHWNFFYDIIYGQTSQQRFDYALFRYTDAEVVSVNGGNLMQSRLRFGSKGNVVSLLQEKLAKKGFFHTNQDGDFARNTLRAVIDYQTVKFGRSEADGVVGNGTAKSLGLELPVL